MNFKYLCRDFFILFIVCFVLNFALTWISIPYGYVMSLDYLSHRPFWAGTLLLFLIFNVFYFLKKSLYLIVSTLLFILSLGIGFVSSIKMAKRDDPLIPQDFYLIKESWNMSFKYLTHTQFALLAIGVIALIAIVIAILKL